MVEKELFSRLNLPVDRRYFLKACGALGIGAIAGGIVQSKFDVVGLGRGLKKVSQNRIAMGTHVTVAAVHQSRDAAEQAIGGAFEEMDRLIAVFTRYDAASPVSVLNRDGRLPGPPRELCDLLEWAGHFHHASNGTFDVTVAPLVTLLEETVGRDGTTFPRDDQIAAALALVDADGVSVARDKIRFRNDGMSVTLDGIAKGYIVDTMSAVLSECGVPNHLVNAGGDIRTSGTTDSGRAWKIAVEDPEKNRDYPDAIEISDGAVATSGNYEVYYDREKVFHHIVDPRSGLSPQNSASVTVRARSVMVADALSTGTFVSQPASGLQLVEAVRPTYNAECLILDTDGKRYTSHGWNS